jgi:hypothetical protein
VPLRRARGFYYVQASKNIGELSIDEPWESLGLKILLVEEEKVTRPSARNAWSAFGWSGMPPQKARIKVSGVVCAQSLHRLLRA